MIYLVSKNKSLFKSTRYKEVPFKEAMEVLLPLKLVQLDTETEGLDAHTKKLLTIQLGNKENQVVFDWQTMTKEEKLALKEYLESDRLFLGWNLMFDLCFLYVNDIWPNHIWDGMIVEQLLWLGYDHKDRSMSLKSAAWNYLNYDLDKTVRGTIITQGLTEDVVVYAAGDVMLIEDIKNKQDIEVAKQNLQGAVQLECEFIKSLAYFKHCGMHLDVSKWRAKMEKDLINLKHAEEALNKWVVDWESEYSKTHKWDIKYPELEFVNPEELEEEIKKLYKDKYVPYPPEDIIGPNGKKITAYRKNVEHRFTYVDTQGDLFTGFDLTPKCNISWKSPKQVIPFFKLLGINTKTFDKETKTYKDSVQADVLLPQKDNFPIIPIYLKYQGASKLVSTYGQNWIDGINPKTGRLHLEMHSIGTITGRVSSGGGVYKLNLQNLPHDKETRACFTAEPGRCWISADYQSQESRIIASVSKDEAMMNLFKTGCGDVHSLVAKMSYPHIIGDCPVEEIGEKFHDYRQEAKGIEFAINYGGDANTIANNKGIPLNEAKNIYNNFMKGFPGVKKYQDYCRVAVFQKGYILMNPVTGHRLHIPNYEDMKRIAERFDDPEYFEYYRYMKKNSPHCQTVTEVTKFFKDKADIEKKSINSRIQNRGAGCFKLASIKFFNWIKKNNLLNKVLMCVPVHDEFNLECPKELVDLVSKVLVKCMEQGAKPFCPNVFLSADVSVSDHWIH